MSSYNGYYSDDRSDRRRERRSRRPIYEEKIVESRQARNQPPIQTALVRRPYDDSSDSIEEIDREFDPESGAYVQRRRIVRDRYGDQYGPPRPRSDAGYSKKSRRSNKDRGRGRRDSYDSYDSESESSPSPPRNRRRQSMGEKALEAVGLGGAAGAIADRVRGRSRSRGRAGSRNGSRDSYYYSNRSRSRGVGGGRRSKSQGVDRREKFEDAAKAALAAAAIEAWRSRKEPGNEAGKRILTAAIGAAGIDAAVQQEDRHGNRNAIASAIGGLATNRLLNGARSRSRSRPGQRGGDGSKAGTAASVVALAALAGKAIKDQRDRSRSRARGDDSDASSGERPRRKSLSERLHGPTDKVLETLGFPHNPENHHPKYYKDQYGRRHYSDSEDDDYNNGNDTQTRLRGGGVANESDSGSSCSTDSYSSSEEEKKIKKGRTREAVTGSLAAIATIHAAHSVYNSMQAREKRHKKVLEGKMTPEEARRLKSRALLQDAAAVGIAALGIKGAVSEWKEVTEQREERRKKALRLEEMREHRRKKMECGEWNEEIARQKRLARSQSGGPGNRKAIAAGGAAGDAAGSQRSSSVRSDTRSRRDDQVSRRSGRAQDSDADDSSDDEYYYENSRGNRQSMPDMRRGYRGGAREKYVPAATASNVSAAAPQYADGPRYADGNPYTSATMPQSSPLSAQLPPPPLGSRYYARRYIDDDS